MRIGIDFDDVVVEYVRELLRWYNHVTGENLAYENVEAWQLEHSMKAWGGGEGTRAMMAAFVYSKRFKQLPEVPGALSTIRALRRRGHEIYFITSRNHRAIQDTYEWFVNNRLPLQNIYFNKEKGWLCDKLKIDVMLDDGIHNLESVRVLSPNTLPIVFDRPWNRDQEGYPRIYKWDDILLYLPDETTDPPNTARRPGNN